MIFIPGSSGWIGSRCKEILGDGKDRMSLLYMAWDVTPPDYWESKNNINCFHNGMRWISKKYWERAVLAGTCVDKGPTLYGKCKKSLSDVYEAYRVTGLSTATGRIFYPYGPEERKERLIPQVINSLLEGREVIVHHPTQMIDLIHVDDVAGAMCALLNSDVQGSVDIGTGSCTTTLRVAQIIGEMIGNPELVKAGNMESGEAVKADTHRLKYEVGYIVKHDLFSGLKDTIDWWKAQ